MPPSRLLCLDNVNVDVNVDVDVDVDENVYYDP
jgi:hypothetical protein